ncbi:MULTISPECIES: hypothetical protein [unclassified Mesotoga]|jgi:hypothetical protein|nr:MULTISPECIES: hypothetical protein [unclassified Mesotoga]
MSSEEGFLFHTTGIDLIETCKGGREGDILEWPVKRQPGGGGEIWRMKRR